MIDVAYIAMGSNLGDRSRHLARARTALGSLPGSKVIGESAVEETDPLGGLAQNKYLNQMIALETTLAPGELLQHLHEIERAEGRTRGVRWASRTLDLDIVCFEQQVVHEANLDVQHPELANHDFWQRELAELRGTP